VAASGRARFGQKHFRTGEKPNAVVYAHEPQANQPRLMDSSHLSTDARSANATNVKRISSGHSSLGATKEE